MGEGFGGVFEIVIGLVAQQDERFFLFHVSYFLKEMLKLVREYPEEGGEIERATSFYIMNSRPLPAM